MIKDTFFSMPRFMNLCRKDMVENWKANVLRMVLLYGVMTIVFLWMGYLKYRNCESDYFLPRYTDNDPAWGFTLMSFLWFLFAFGSLSASLTMERMKNKTGRLSILMTPATPFEKYFSRWVLSTIIFLIVFLIAFKLADYTRVLVYSLIYPVATKAIYPVNLSNLISDVGQHSAIFSEMRLFMLLLSSFLFVQSLFVLGSSIWPKNSFLKTFVGVAIIVLIYIVVGLSLGNMLFSRSNNINYGYILSPINDQQGYTLSTMALILFALFNWVLAYFRFKESEIIQRM